MKKNLVLIISLLISCVPINMIKIFLYKVFLRYDIDYKTKIGFCNIICMNRAKIRKSKIGNFNIIIANKVIIHEAMIVKLNRIKNVDVLEMRTSSIINKKNLIMGDGKHNLFLDERTEVLVEMLVDVSADITLGKNVCFAGTGTQIWTHSFDKARKKTIKPITIGDDIYIGSRVLINPGVNICNNVTIGGGTIVSKNITEPGLYVSSTLIKKK